MVLSDIEIKVISVELRLSKQEQVDRVVSEIRNIRAKSSIIRVSLCIDEKNNARFFEQKAKLNSILDKLPVGILAQAPVDDSYIVAEVWTIPSETYRVSYFEEKTFNYAKINDGVGEMLVACGIAVDLNSSIKKESIYAFDAIGKLLKSNDYSWSNIIRQWNYIPNILFEYTVGKENLQNYQIFNDVRSEYYKNECWKDGYPSATGIGCDCGTLSIDIIAYRATKEVTVLPLKNKVQKDAHVYNENVLVGNKASITTPKFERAKIIADKNSSTCLISGTAAILGEDSVGMTANEQTRLTFENINTLISQENLVDTSIKSPELKPTFYKGYTTKNSDGLEVQNLFNTLAGKVIAFFVYADICREDLMVEIEGLAKG